MPVPRLRRTGWARLAGTLVLAATVVVAIPATTVLAQDAPAPGGPAVVANSGGNTVLLRDAASADGGILTAYPEGTPLTVLDGPFWDADGQAWYQVAADGTSGYMQGAYLAADAAPADAGADPGVAAAPSDGAPADASTDEAATADAAPSDGATDPNATADAAPQTLFATADLNLRAGPSAEDAILTVVPAGESVETTGETTQGYLGASWGGQSGWLDGDYLAATAPAAPAPAAATDAAPETAATDATAAAVPTDGTLLGDPSAVPSGTAAYATDLVNLRAAADDASAVLRVLPPGSPVTLLGADSGGYTPVWYNGTQGWIASSYLTTTAPAEPVGTAAQGFDAGTTAPAADGAAAAPADERSGDATVLEDALVRSDPSPTAGVVTTLATGTELQPTGEQVSGFYPVAVDGTSGWVSGALLAFKGDGRDKGDTGSKKSPNPPSTSGTASGPGLIWPVSGGTWSVLQGYDGSSHENESDLWQYQYSFDLVRDDGTTAGQPVVSPLAGQVRWFDPSTGGISIDVGNGHAVAMFHLTVDPKLKVGDQLDQGEYVGTISDVGGPGFREVPHVHLALWGTNDGGNWDRHAEPFVGAYAIEGHEFPDIGGTYQYDDYTFNP